MLVNPIIDLTCSQPFYQWLLSEETSFDVADLKCIDQDIDKTVTNLQGIINEKAKLNNLANYVSLVRHWMLIEGVSTQMDSITNLFSIMAGYDQDEQRAFLQFVTGWQAPHWIIQVSDTTPHYCKEDI